MRHGGKHHPLTIGTGTINWYREYIAHARDHAHLLKDGAIPQPEAVGECRLCPDGSIRRSFEAMFSRDHEVHRR
jgi:hypothetical protein